MTNSMVDTCIVSLENSVWCIDYSGSISHHLHRNDSLVDYCAYLFNLLQLFRICQKKCKYVLNCSLNLFSEKVRTHNISLNNITYAENSSNYRYEAFHTMVLVKNATYLPTHVVFVISDIFVLCRTMQDNVTEKEQNICQVRFFCYSHSY